MEKIFSVNFKLLISYKSQFLINKNLQELRIENLNDLF